MALIWKNASQEKYMTVEAVVMDIVAAYRSNVDNERTNVKWAHISSIKTSATPCGRPPHGQK